MVLSIDQFKNTIKKPHQFFDDPILQCLYLIKNNKWESAHNIAQNINTKNGMLLHGYLHKLEGDLWNADYWFRKAGLIPFVGTAEEEWEFILKKCFNK